MFGFREVYRYFCTVRYFIHIQYDGAAYCGWQRQPDAPTVQQRLDEALATLLRRPVETVGSGRTDTGVNARCQVAHFDLDTPLPDPAQTVYKLNAILPADIAAVCIRAVRDDAHARFSAREREYRYFIQPRKCPFTRHSTWSLYRELDLDAMNRAAERLLRYDDFTTFAKLNSNNRTNICHIRHARWERLEDGRLCFTIRADRFLRNMVRSIVGTLVDVGRGRYTVEEFDRRVAARDLSLASGGAPAAGLFLWDVTYDDALYIDRHQPTE